MIPGFTFASRFFFFWGRECASKIMAQGYSLVGLKFGVGDTRIVLLAQPFFKPLLKHCTTREKKEEEATNDPLYKLQRRC